jgi:hypothetical protein
MQQAAERSAYIARYALFCGNRGIIDIFCVFLKSHPGLGVLSVSPSQKKGTIDRLQRAIPHTGRGYDANKWTLAKGVPYMENSTSVKTFNDQFLPRRTFIREKEKSFRTKNYLEVLIHYDAELVQTDGPIMVVRRKTGTELPLGQTGKLQMVKALLDEFATVDGTNEAIGNYKVSHP